MEGIDYEFAAAAKDFMSRAVKADKPFFVWMNYTRVHVWTRQKKEYRGITGISLYADNMWMMVPAQGFVQKFMGSIEGYPFRAGSSLSAGNIGYGTLEMAKAKGGLKRLLDKANFN